MTNTILRTTILLLLLLAGAATKSRHPAPPAGRGLGVGLAGRLTQQNRSAEQPNGFE